MMDIKEKFNDLTIKKKYIDDVIIEDTKQIELLSKEIRKLKDNSLVIDGALQILQDLIDDDDTDTKISEEEEKDIKA